jgi:hypothetical protein
MCTSPRLSREHVHAFSGQDFDVRQLDGRDFFQGLALAVAQMQITPNHDDSEERQQAAANVEQPDHRASMAMVRAGMEVLPPI